MNPLPIIGDIIDYGIKIYKFIDTVKGNKKQCERLAERVTIVIDALNLESDEAQEYPSKGLEDLKDVIVKAVNFVESFTNQNTILALIKADPNNTKFTELSTRLIEAANLVTLSNSNRILKLQQEMKEQDKEDREFDREAAKRMESKLDKLNEGQDKVVVDIEKMKEMILFLVAQQQKLLIVQDKKTMIEIASFTLAESDQIPKSAVTLHELIGKGTFSEVYRGTWKGQTVAIKKYKETEITRFKHEIAILKRLQHEKEMPIVKFFGAWMQTDNNCIAMELMQCTLHDALYKKRLTLSYDQKSQIILDIAAAMHHLYRKATIHRDIKSKNILLDNNTRAKLADFGLSNVTTQSLAMTSDVSQAYAYQAPEVLSNQGRESFQSDVYSFGVLMQEIYSGKLPESNKHPMSENIDPFYKELIRSCKSEKREYRPSISDLCTKLEYPLKLYTEGQNLENAGDFNNALKKYQEAASLNYSRGLCAVALFHYHGKGGLSTDKVKAETLYLKSAELGYHRAQYSLAIAFFERGQLDNATKWAELAAAQNNPKAKDLLGEISKKAHSKPGMSLRT